MAEKAPKTAEEVLKDLDLAVNLKPAMINFLREYLDTSYRELTVDTLPRLWQTYQGAVAHFSGDANSRERSDDNLGNIDPAPPFFMGVMLQVLGDYKPENI